MAEVSQTTELLQAMSAGSRSAAEQLLPVVYEELRGLAAGYLRRERPDHTLQPTALVHEAYMRLVGDNQPSWSGRAHFLAVAAQAMRRALVNHAVARNAEKRGGGRTLLTLDAALTPAAAPGIDALDLSDAIDRLAALDERKSRLLEMRFFAGMTMEETAGVLGVSLSTAESDWRFARAWLAYELRGGAAEPIRPHDA
jgi:RNA polymerase sigma-70 factor (ECF subfamily)